MISSNLIKNTPPFLSPPYTTFELNSYQVYSSALGGAVIWELGFTSAGWKKRSGFIYAGGAKIAVQTGGSGITGDTPAIGWVYRNPATGSQRGFVETEPDPMGADAGLESTGVGGGYDPEQDPAHSHIMIPRYAAALDTDPGCIIDKIPAPCSIAYQMLGSGAADQVIDSYIVTNYSDGSQSIQYDPRRVDPDNLGGLFEDDLLTGSQSASPFSLGTGLEGSAGEGGTGQEGIGGQHGTTGGVRVIDESGEITVGGEPEETNTDDPSTDEPSTNNATPIPTASSLPPQTRPRIVDTIPNPTGNPLISALNHFLGTNPNCLQAAIDAGALLGLGNYAKIIAETPVYNGNDPSVVDFKGYDPSHPSLTFGDEIKEAHSTGYLLYAETTGTGIYVTPLGTYSGLLKLGQTMFHESLHAYGIGRGAPRGEDHVAIAAAFHLAAIPEALGRDLSKESRDQQASDVVNQWIAHGCPKS